MSPINHFLAKRFIYLTLLISSHKSVLQVFGSCLVLFSELPDLSISRNVYNIPDRAVLALYRKWLFILLSLMWCCLLCPVLYWPFHTISCWQVMSFSISYLLSISFIIIASQISPSCYSFSDALPACIFFKGESHLAIFLSMVLFSLGNYLLFSLYTDLSVFHTFICEFH